jgi:hypothetical protein
MTFEEWWPTGRSGDWYSEKDLAQEVWRAAQQAERERIKSRVKEAAENLWCIRNQVGENPYSLYIGPSLRMMEEFVDRLLEET